MSHRRSSTLLSQVVVTDSVEQDSAFLSEPYSGIIKPPMSSISHYTV
jgi:hypothetical protein